jgi:hypothetical protein
MAVLVVLVEGFVARRKMDFLDMDDWAYRRAGQVAARDAGRYQVLCFGDSLIKLGVVPRAIEQRTGWRAYNLAVSGSQTPASYFLLRRALSSGTRPKAVVVGFTPPLLSVGPRHQLWRWASLVSVMEAAELAWSAGDSALFGAVVMGKVLPSLRARASVRDSLMAALENREPGRRWLNFLSFRQWNRNAGAQLMQASDAIPTLTESEIETVRRMYYSRFACHPANSAAIERFLTQAAAHHVPVYWVLTPLLPAVHSRLVQTGFDSQHEAFVRSWQARFPSLIVVDGRGTIPASGGFWDAVHLSGAGAYAFSLTLADALRRTCYGERVPESRWIDLPVSRVRPLPVDVEDIVASRAGLEAKPKPRH